MNREDAIVYLEEKDKIEGKTAYSKEEEKKIDRVMKEGKIYGDPIAKIQW